MTKSLNPYNFISKDPSKKFFYSFKRGNNSLQIYDLFFLNFLVISENERIKLKINILSIYILYLRDFYL